jgi:hypothetical protein
MRHPAAPTIIAILLGFLAFMILWSRIRGDGHHEGNPDPRDLPKKKPDTEETNEPTEGEGEQPDR